MTIIFFSLIWFVSLRHLAQMDPLVQPAGYDSDISNDSIILRTTAAFP